MIAHDDILFLGGNPHRHRQQWVQFLLDFGNRFASERSLTQRSVLALILPTRAFAAPLISVGIVLNQSRKPPSFFDLDGHFRTLCELPVGAKVVYSNNQKRYESIVDSHIEFDGSPAVSLHAAKQHNTKFLVTKNLAGKVEILNWEGKLPEKIKGRPHARHVSFVESLIGDHLTRDFLTKSRIEAVIIGNLKLLTHEVRGVPLNYYTKNNGNLVGCIHDVLRVKHFLPGQAYRTEIISNQSDQKLEEHTKNDAAIIFDGSQSFLKHRHEFLRHDWVVILDRTSHGFPEAVQAINGHFVDSKRDDTSIVTANDEAPWGVELLAFKESPVV